MKKKKPGAFLSKAEMFRRRGSRLRSFDYVEKKALKAGCWVKRTEHALLVWSPGAHAIYTEHGKFWGVTPTGVAFHSDDARLDSMAWMQKLLRFFWIEGPET